MLIATPLIISAMAYLMEEGTADDVAALLVAFVLVAAATLGIVWLVNRRQKQMMQLQADLDSGTVFWDPVAGYVDYLGEPVKTPKKTSDIVVIVLAVILTLVSCVFWVGFFVIGVVVTGIFGLARK